MLGKFSGAVPALLCATLAIAEPGYPNRAVTVVVPLGAGSGTDIMARVLAEGLSDTLGKRFVVENRPGASGATGAEYVARAPNDGYTLMLGGNGTHSAVPHLLKAIKYDPITDFTPIARLATAGGVLIVSPASKIKAMADLVREAKANPRHLTYGAANSGAQIAGEMIKRVADIDIIRVPYRTTPQAMTDVIGGSITMTFVDVAAALSNVKSGKVRAIAITSGKRTPLLPEVPTMHEVGITDFDLTYWTGLFAPANVPDVVVAALDRATGEIMKARATEETLTNLGLDPAYIGRAEMPAYVRTELQKWGNYIRDAGIEPN